MRFFYVGHDRCCQLSQLQGTKSAVFSSIQSAVPGTIKLWESQPFDNSILNTAIWISCLEALHCCELLLESITRGVAQPHISWTKQSHLCTWTITCTPFLNPLLDKAPPHATMRSGHGRYVTILYHAGQYILVKRWEGGQDRFRYYSLLGIELRLPGS